MKKMMLILACVFTVVTNANADNYRPINVSQLPEKAQTFLTTYFPEAKVSLARKEFDVTELSYDVIFTNGSKVEFDRKGEWTEVDCLTQPLPAGIVPATIEKVIKEQYPDAKATKIERDRREIDVKLSNRVELTFNKKMQLIDID
ncbi:MAG: PepSY-like domain-containing protein [Bacteroidaceae bacterium]|nr:PepSY-like domain-containing protein [Bacteroidaceae bacterium]MBQ3239450.1 PepSY-like domain-containing protein [Bacteroidaceae bacterium]MBR4042133.1 PepSY-like domain-containing protein [Bacteroidaceae bacterium]MBR6628680.1 PepSY-like domain-containing protein [Bacteroidaceae bacterium]